MRLVLFVLVLTLAACSGPAPVAPHPAAKTTCSLCDFLGNEDYTIADGEGAHESPDSDSSSETEAEADSTQAASSLLADSNLESVVRQALDQSQGPLTPEDVASLISLSASDKSIHSVAGLEHFTALQKLDLRNNQITDVTPLSHLITLRDAPCSLDRPNGAAIRGQPDCGCDTAEPLDPREMVGSEGQFDCRCDTAEPPDPSVFAEAREQPD